MTNYTKEELQEALKAIISTNGKCEKAILKLKENSAQHTLLSRRIKAFRISIELIERELLICIVFCLLLLSSCTKKLQTKESFRDIRKAEIAARQKKSRKELEKSSVVGENYAVQLINNANSAYYPKKSGALICLKGRELIKIFEDSARTRKSNMELETLYDTNGLTKRSATYMDKVLFSESVYYRNPHHLIDSIINTDKNGLKTRSVFKYRKDQYTIISVDGKNVMTSNVFYLNYKLQCIKKETFNGSGDLVGASTFKYDDSGRIIEEVDETRKMVYEYKNQQADFYSSLKFYSIKDAALLTENLRYEDKAKTVFISKNADKVFSKTVSLNNAHGCINIVYNYNSDNKITQVYEYLYEN